MSHYIEELILRMREAATQKVANTAMISVADLSVAAHALKSQEAAYASAVEAGKALAKQAFKAEQERDTLADKLKALLGDQTPTAEDINLLEWKGMKGVFAFHLIERHADDWSHVARLMNAWLEANREDLVAELKALREQEPVAWNVVSEGRKHGLHRLEKDARSHVKRLQCHPFSAIAIAPTAIPLYALPVPARELTDETIQRHWDEACKDTPQTPGWSRHIRFARAIERHLKGDGE